jgi:cellulose synthase/poly-beta-1,6-N-acetylglucosamine synthase-like glycosyltransferase
MIWLMLLYHMFLMQGGYFLFWRFESPIQEWKSKRKQWQNVTILIPAHNEAIVIKQTLASMVKLTYPKDHLQVILINDNSSDQTEEIGRTFAKKYPFIQVVTTNAEYKGKGKSTALNYGVQFATGSIIIVYDADNTPEPEAVEMLTLALDNDPKAAATVGKFRVINAAKNVLTRFINIETICFQWMAQGGRAFWFNLTTIPGTNFAIRRSVLDEVGGWDPQALAEDTELSIRIYDLGYHIRFFPAAVTWEQEPENFKVWWKQRTRWARGNQYVIVKFFLRFFQKKQKLNILFDLFYFLFTYFIFLLSVLISNTIFILNLFFDLNLEAGAVTLVLWILAYLLYVTEIMIALNIEKTEMTKKNFFIVLLMYFTYSQLWILLVIHALYLELKRILLKQDVKWDKTERFKQSS